MTASDVSAIYEAKREAEAKRVQAWIEAEHLCRVIVCGGRDFKDADLLCAVLDRFHYRHRITLVIEGEATGADLLAREWAQQTGVPVRMMPANWHKHGRKAGPIRNEQMLAERPDWVIAFPGGRGTAHMMRIAIEAGVPVNDIAEEWSERSALLEFGRGLTRAQSEEAAWNLMRAPMEWHGYPRAEAERRARECVGNASASHGEGAGAIPDGQDKRW